MSIFSKIFGDSEHKDSQHQRINWQLLTEMQQVGHLISESFDKPVFIFKHSTKCAISRMALKQFESHYNIDEGAVDPYFLDLLNYREISNEIADRLEVTHQSPQLILVMSGKCIYTSSHSDIDAEELEEKLSEKTKHPL